MGFSQAVRTCLSNYVTFSGRAGRPEYWWFVLFVVIGSAVSGVIDGTLFGTPAGPSDPQARPLSTLFHLATAIPLLAAGWRRMHDTGRPGWYLLLPMLVSLAFLFSVLLGVFALGAMEAAGADPAALTGPAALLGASGLIAVYILQVALAVLMLWWLTRPSDPGANGYGPPPA